LTVATAPTPRDVLRSVRAATTNAGRTCSLWTTKRAFVTCSSASWMGEGYQLHEAATGREAIAKLEADKPDLVLLD